MRDPEEIRREEAEAGRPAQTVRHVLSPRERYMIAMGVGVEASVRRNARRTATTAQVRAAGRKRQKQARRLNR